MNDSKTLRSNIKAQLNRQNAEQILSLNGYEVTRDHKFKMRLDERTPSASVRHDGYIKDFGGDGFSGDVVSFLHEVEGKSLSDATHYVADFLGINNDAPIASTKKRSSVKPAYDLQEIHKSCIAAREAMIPEKFHNIMTEQLLDPRLFGSHDKREFCKKRLGYSTKYQSLTISLMDNSGTVQAVAIRKAGNIKWKTYGSKTFIPCQISGEDEVIFFYSGMGEIVLMEALGLHYIGLQSDSVGHHLPGHLKELCRGKIIAILSDNDKSFKKLISKIKSFFEFSEVVVIDFENVLDRDLHHGYDFRDFCNEIVDPKNVLEYLENEIVRSLENV